MTAVCKQPKVAAWGTVLEKTMALCKTANDACDNRSAMFSNQKAVAEALNVVMIVTTPAPADHIQMVLESVDFHAMKVMGKKNPTETAWVKALKQMLVSLKEWCATNCKTGLSWKADGQDPVQYAKSGPGAAAPAPAKGKGKGKAPGPPPPPKDGLAPFVPKAAPPASDEAGGMAAVM